MKDDRFDRGSQKAFPEQERLHDAWERLTPDDKTKDRMLARILEKKDAPAPRASNPRNAWILALSCLLLCCCLLPLAGVFSPAFETDGAPRSAEGQETGGLEADNAESFPAAMSAPESSAEDFQGLETASEAVPEDMVSEFAAPGAVAGEGKTALVLRDSTGLHAYFEEQPEAFGSADPKRPTAAASQSLSEDRGAYDVRILGEIVSVQYLELQREDGSHFSHTAVITIEVLSSLAGEMQEGTVTAALPEAVLKRLSLSEGPWELPKAGQRGIFSLRFAPGKVTEKNGAVLCWSDLADFLLDEEELTLLILEGGDGLLYEKDSFPKLSPELSIQSAGEKLSDGSY